MEKRKLITILSQKKEWFNENRESAASKSGDVIIADVTYDFDSFQKFLKSIGVQIESVDEKAAFEELRKYINEKYNKGRWAFKQCDKELSSLISHFVSTLTD